MALRQLFYLSRAVGTPTEATLRHILDRSRRNNWRDDITGCLLYSGRHFAQILEGRGDAIDALMARLADDARHRDLTVIADHDIDAREFPDWSMGFLYKLDVADRVDALLANHRAPEEWVEALAAEMRLDSVMGSL